MSTEMILSGRGQIAITASPEGLRLSSPYDPGFVAAFKRTIPANARRWDGQAKQWIIDPACGPTLVKEIHTFFGVEIDLPKAAAPAAPVTVTDLIQLAYLGACKNRDDGSFSASGYLLGNRNPRMPDLTIPEAVLKAWFEGPGVASTITSRIKPAPPSSLYAVLCVPQDIDSPGLKTAYRRMARQTHPDVNKEPDAADQFRRVQAAYEVLSDSHKRRKYDAGLALERRATGERDDERYLRGLPPIVPSLFRTPLRCGLLVVQGVKRLGRLEVASILAWNDLERGGRVLVSSWPSSADVWIESWITP